MITRRALGVFLYGDDGGVVVRSCPQLWVLVQGVGGDGVLMFPAVESKEGVEALPGVPGPAGIGRGCRLPEGVHAAVSVLPEKKSVFPAQLVVAPFLLPPPLEGHPGCWEFLENMLVVLLGVHKLG